ncbi:hypothetical protein J1N35_039097 [Gossypium stocksii]|uniref:Uncharacterized protein n=1 Tax=Gossypium stocksii TaxID=47602 RepID=A0A9D3UN51_9ROSI|nr:hypothetical protein J1N35_039097 [Gossypium stocksii]
MPRLQQLQVAVIPWVKVVVLTRYCFASFCEKCMGDCIVSMATSVCRRQIMGDDLLHNMNLRDTINRILNNPGKFGTEASAMKKEAHALNG